jgi:hypothetical protein
MGIRFLLALNLPQKFIPAANTVTLTHRLPTLWIAWNVTNHLMSKLKFEGSQIVPECHNPATHTTGARSRRR